MLMFALSLELLCSCGCWVSDDIVVWRWYARGVLLARVLALVGAELGYSIGANRQ